MSTRELSADRSRRHRAAAAPVWPPALPALDVDERELLADWLRGSADSRPWPGLLDAAGPARIELADRLADKALAAGLLTLKEKFERGRWQRAGVAWVELEALQTALGLPTRRPGPSSHGLQAGPGARRAAAGAGHLGGGWPARAAA